MLRPHLSSRSIKTFSELLFLHDTDADQAGDAKEQQSDQQCDEGHDACIDGRHGVQHRQKVNTDEFQSVKRQPADDKQPMRTMRPLSPPNLSWNGSIRARITNIMDRIKNALNHVSALGWIPLRKPTDMAIIIASTQAQQPRIAPKIYFSTA